MLREKAGIDLTKREEIEKIVKECTENSKFSILEKSKKENLEKKSAKIIEYLSLIDKEEFKKAWEDSDAIYLQIYKILQMLVETRKVYAHIDMDAYYAQVEALDNPELAQVPMAVGGDSMLATSNYAARKFGVRAAMPGFIAKRLCPDLVLIEPNFPKYERLSKKIREILHKYDPNLISVGLDEAYLDISGLINDDKNCEKCVLNFVQNVKREILAATGLTCSIGVSHSQFLAKMCSNIKKPDGHFVILKNKSQEDLVRDFVFSQPVGRINGVGPVTEALLKVIDVNTCRDIYDRRDRIWLVFGAKRAFWLFCCSLGIDEPCRDIENKVKSKNHTLGLERTFKPTSDIKQMFSYLENISLQIRDMLREKRLKTNKVVLKIKFDNFHSITRTHTFIEYTDSDDQIKNAAQELLLKEVDGKQFVRLLGLRVNRIGTTVSSPKTPSRINLTLDMFCKKGNDKPDLDNSLVNCPVCFIKLTNKNWIINQHLDQCLEQNKNIN